MKEHDFPDKKLATASHTHILNDLLGVAGLKKKLGEQEQLDEDFKLNWAVAKQWSEGARYVPMVEETMAKDFFEAVTDDELGILVWIKNWW